MHMEYKMYFQITYAWGLKTFFTKSKKAIASIAPLRGVRR